MDRQHTEQLLRQARQQVDALAQELESILLQAIQVNPWLLSLCWAYLNQLKSKKHQEAQRLESLIDHDSPS